MGVACQQGSKEVWQFRVGTLSKYTEILCLTL